MHCRMLSSTPGLYPLDSRSTPPHNPRGDNQNCLHTWPKVSWGKSLPSPPVEKHQVRAKSEPSDSEGRCLLARPAQGGEGGSCHIGGEEKNDSEAGASLLVGLSS